MFAVVLATAPGTLTLKACSQSTSFQVPAGISQFNAPLVPGCGMEAILTRDGQTVVDVNPTDFTFVSNPQTYNYNAVVASGSSADSSSSGSN